MANRGFVLGLDENAIRRTDKTKKTICLAVSASPARGLKRISRSSILLYNYAKLI